MVGVPVYCGSCGNLFESRMIKISGKATNITFSNCGESCPQCGRPAAIAEGTFDFDEDMIRVVAGSEWTREQVNRILAAYNQAQQEGSLSENVIEALSQVSPELANIAQFLSTKRGGFTILMFLLALALNRCNVNLNVDLDVNELYNQIIVERSLGDADDA